MYQNAQADFAEKILPVLDNFDRAIAACEDKEDGFFKGVEMVHKQFVEILSGLGITPIPTVGETFNPDEMSSLQDMQVRRRSLSENGPEIFKSTADILKSETQKQNAEESGGLSLEEKLALKRKKLEEARKQRG